MLAVKTWVKFIVSSQHKFLHTKQNFSLYLAENPSIVASLLPKHAGSHFRRRFERSRACRRSRTWTPQHAQRGRVAGRCGAGVRKQAGSTECDDGRWANGQAETELAAQSKVVYSSHLCNARKRSLRGSRLALERARKVMKRFRERSFIIVDIVVLSYAFQFRNYVSRLVIIIYTDNWFGEFSCALMRSYINLPKTQPGFFSHPRKKKAFYTQM